MAHIDVRKWRETLKLQCYSATREHGHGRQVFSHIDQMFQALGLVAMSPFIHPVEDLGEHLADGDALKAAKEYEDNTPKQSPVEVPVE